MPERNTPRLLKGALVSFATSAPIPTNVIVFQFNPDSLTRTFQQQVERRGYDDWYSSGDTEHTLPPIESYSLTVELDAEDQLADPQAFPLVLATGLHPELAALELLMYPPSSEIILGSLLAKQASKTITPAKVPVVLFVWGPARVIPVRVTSVSITEQQFDQILNPIQARVELGLRGLTKKELQSVGGPFETLALVNQVAKEVLARSQPPDPLGQQIAGLLPF